MLERLDILSASTLFMAWGRSGMDNEPLFEAVANEIKRKHSQKLFYEDGAVSEIANIM